jgi:hypothetical protein
VLEFYSVVVRLWISLTIVKTVMGYLQIPMMLRIFEKTTSKPLGRIEIAQMVMLSPLVNLIALPHYIYKERWLFFQPYDEAFMEQKFKEMGPL